MKKNLAFLVVMAAVFLAIQAHAGNESAHGGQGVVCYDSSHNIISVALRDYYEGENTYKSKLDFAGATGDFSALLDATLNRLALIDPIAAKRLQTRANAFIENASFIGDSQIRQIGDASVIINPGSQCFYEQLAIQMFNLKEGQKAYFVNKDLWNRADKRTKAGLILHEIILTDAVKQGQENSDGTRYYNYMISSDFMNQVSAFDYIKVLEDAFPWSHNDSYDPKYLSRFFSVQINGILVTNLDLSDSMIYGSTSGQFQVDDWTFSPTQAKFFNDGSFAFEFDGSHDFSLSGGTITVSKIVWLDAKKEVIGGNLAHPTPYRVQGQTVLLQSSNWSPPDFYLYPSGNLKKGYIQSGVTLKGTDGKSRTLDSGSFGSKKNYLVEFDSNGLLMTADKVNSGK